MSTCSLFKAVCLASGAANWWPASRQSNRLTQMLWSQLAWLLNPRLEMAQMTPNIPPYFTFSSELTLTCQSRALAVSSSVLCREATKVLVFVRVNRKLRGLTLFCCPWFSYNIATTPCCRRLCSAMLAVREYISTSSFLTLNRHFFCLI